MTNTPKAGNGVTDDGGPEAFAARSSARQIVSEFLRAKLGGVEADNVTKPEFSAMVELVYFAQSRQPVAEGAAAVASKIYDTIQERGNTPYLWHDSIPDDENNAKARHRLGTIELIQAEIATLLYATPAAGAGAGGSVELDAAGQPKQPLTVLESVAVDACNHVKAWAESDRASPFPEKAHMLAAPAER